MQYHILYIAFIDGRYIGLHRYNYYEQWRSSNS